MVLIECLLKVHRQNGVGERKDREGRRGRESSRKIKALIFWKTLPLLPLLPHHLAVAQKTECANPSNCAFDILWWWGGWGGWVGWKVGMRKLQNDVVCQPWAEPLGTELGRKGLEIKVSLCVWLRCSCI